MGIRSKFLFLLLVSSILPLLVFLVFHQHAFQAVGRDIYEIARLLLLQTAARDVQASAQNHGKNLGRELQLIDALMSARLEFLEAGPETSPPGQRGTAARPLGDRLETRIALIYDEVAALRKDLVVLEMVFPGGGVIRHPADAQGRAAARPPEELYAMMAEDDPAASIWVWPAGNEGQGRHASALVTLLLPLRSRDGTLRAVAAAGFDMLAVLEAARPSSQWSPYMQTILLQLPPRAARAREAPLIIGARKPASSRPRWRAAMEALKLAPEDAETVYKLHQESFFGNEGYVSLLFEGEATLIAYAAVEEALGIANLLPEREVLYRIARHPGRLSRWLFLDSVLAAGAVIVVLVLFAVHRSRRMLHPFFAMMAAFKSVSEGNLAARLTFAATDERRMVAEAFNKMVVDLEEGFRTRQALEVAHEVQHNLIPETGIERAGLDIAVRIRYCEETGGDYIDILEEKQERVGVVVGDVTGHGIGAALLMATARALIRGSYAAMDDLAGLMEGANRNLCADMGTTGRFVTVFLLEIDLATRELQWVRAGHDPAWLYRAETGAIRLLDGPGVALGVDSVYCFDVNRGVRMAPGDIVLIGTDGIWETAGPGGDLFGKSRVETVLRESAGRSAAEIGAALMAAVDGFRGDRRLDDDVSLAVVKKGYEA